MRRVLFISFLTLTAFSVVGGNYLHVAAPDLASEINDQDTTAGSTRVSPPDNTPAGMAALSADRLAGTISAQPAAPQTVVVDPHANNTLAELQFPIEVRELSSDVARNPEAPQPLFLSTWTEIPLAAAHSLGIATDHPNDLPDDSTIARAKPGPERENSSYNELPYFIAALTEIPKAIFSPAALEQPVTEPKIAAPEVTNSDVHSAALSNVEVELRRDTSSVPEPSSTLEKDSILASVTAAPSADFSRPRTDAMPTAPVFAKAEFQGSEHQALNSYLESTFDRDSSAAADSHARSSMPLFVAASFETPASIFDRPRIAEEPKAPAFEALVFNDHAQLDRATYISEERFEVGSPDGSASIGSRLATFISALAEIPSLVYSPMSREQAPKVPATTVYASSTHDSVGNDAESVSPGRDSIATADASSGSILPMFVKALAELPTSIVANAPLLETPTVPVRVEQMHPSNDSSLTVSEVRGPAEIPAGQSRLEPAAITANTTMATSMLVPMNREVLVSAPLSDESSLIASNMDLGRGGDSATQFDRMLAPPDASMRTAGTAPVLISGRPEFTMDLLKPMNSAATSPFVKLSGQEELAALQRQNNYCDPNWIGPPIRFSQTVQLKLEDLINQLHQRFGVNFILGKGVAELPLNVKAGSIPWNVLLRSQLFISGVRARCIDDNTIELVENATIPSLQDMADVETRFVKLRFLQRTGSGTVDLANRSQGSNQGGQGGGCGGNNQGGGTSGSASSGSGGGAGGQQGQTVGQLTNNKYDKLIVEIEKILGLRSMTERAGGQGGDQGGGVQQAAEVVRTNRFVTEIPGRNILAIRATKEEHQLIDEFIRRADRPPFQVVIKGLVYTANQDRIRDIGVQTTITGGTADGRTTGGVFGDTLGTGTLFDFSTIIGTFDFNVQATAFQQNGIISVKSRPFATVIDGLCTTLDVGRQLPIVIDSTLGGQGDVVFVNAANNLAVTPYVLDDDQGNPMAVTLELRLTANDIDSSVTARDIPAISARSIQTQLLLDENKTAILGGFTVDSDSRTDRKVPGLGDIPVIGELFRRRIRDARVNRLYFAISVDVITYPDPIRTVDVPGATTQPPSITPKQKGQADKMEPEQVIAVPTPKGP